MIERVELREVEYIPEQLDEGVLYVSHRFATALHKCCCGCGGEVVTPLSPRDWSISQGSGGVRLSPSIGNWSYPCNSHYWIWDGMVVWDKQWSPKRIKAGRERERITREAYYSAQESVPETVSVSSQGIWRRLWNSFVKWLNS